MSEYIIRTTNMPEHVREALSIWHEKNEEIVRCRDCVCFAVDKSDHEHRSGWWCTRWSTDVVKPDGFCSWGERRED